MSTLINNNYILVRHGQTNWNKLGVMHGQYDIPLNYTGEKQAYKISKELKDNHIDICFSSPLKRAKKTAIKILENHRNIKIIYDNRLMELSKGKLEGKFTNSEKILKSENNTILKQFNIESKKDFFNRVKEFLEYLEKKYSNKNILIVAHSGTLKMIMFYFNYPSKPLHLAYYDLHIKNATAYKINLKNKEHIKMKIGLFPMVADILHSGHVLAMEEAKKHCDYLIVALHSNPTYKTTQQTIYERYIQLRAIKWVDEVVPYENTIKDNDIFTSLDYNVYFLGEDHKNEDWQNRDLIESLEKEIVYLGRKHNFSSSRIKENAKI